MNADLEVQNMKAGENVFETIALIFRNVVGFAMVLGGIAIGVWVFSQIYNAVFDPGKLSVFKNLVPSDIEFVAEIADSNARITIPGEFLAYLIPIMLLAMAVNIGISISKNGVNLLYGNLQKLLLKVIDLEHQAGKHVDARVSPLVKRVEHLESMIVYEEPQG